MSIVEEKRDEIAAFCEANGIEYLGVFGSYARGDFDEGSDIDFIVRFANPIDLFDFSGVHLGLQDILSKEVDLITEKSINPYVKDYILKDLRPVYERR